MPVHMPQELLHVAGYLTGVALYAMLLIMALRDTSSDRLTVGAAGLGLTWNVGELGGHGLSAMGWLAVERWTAALAFTALGFLAAVVIHSVARGTRDEAIAGSTSPRALTTLAYTGAGLSGALQVGAALRGESVPDSIALLLLTCVLIALAPVLLVATRRQPNGRRAIWMTALTVFAISALHVTNFHGPRESWATELLGHHSSMPLAFAILYQDYRFALADLFLKQALTLVLVVAVVFGFWSLAGPALTRTPGSPEAIGLLLGVWVVSTYLFPMIRRTANVFIDRVVLRRADARRTLDEVSAALQDATTEDDLLGRACRALGPALSAIDVTFEQRHGDLPTQSDRATVAIPTVEAPRYQLRVGRLAGGRRLLSDDVAMLDRIAAAVGHRIDTLRIARERYDRVLREREMQGLATEAELNALRAQINPHFLFNALTTIGYLIQESPRRALTTLMRLTALLRGVLRAEGEFTTLRREVELIVCYLDIERERFEERLDVAVTIPDALADIVIPTLVVQPLVENAIKHGIAESLSGGRVTVEARLDDDRRLCVSVRNTGAPLTSRLSALGSGVGLRNIEQRLASYYGQAGTLTLATTTDGDTMAEIRVPVAEMAGAVAAVGRGRMRD